MAGFSELLIPLLLAVTALWGLWRRVDVYDALVCGAGEGLKLALRICPPLVVLLTGVALLRASGGLDILQQALTPLLLGRPLSGSGALGVGAELMGEYGPDSLIGRTAAVMLGSTETTFYTIAVYFGGAGIRRTRYAIPAALCADAAGFWAAAWATRLFFGG